jgi:hypothetical protein
VTARPEQSYMVRIQGLPGSGTATILSYCGPALPAYGSAPAFVVGLSAIPSGGGSEWKPLELRATVGGFTVLLHGDLDTGPPLLVLDPEPIGYVDENLLPAETAFDVAVTADLEDGSTLYIEGETVHVTTYDEANARVTVATRAAAETEAGFHLGNARIYLAPPWMTGREVTVLRAPRAAASSAAEVVLRRGHIVTPQQHAGLSITLECDTSVGSLRLERHPRGYTMDAYLSGLVAGGVYVTPPGFLDGVAVLPRYSDDGGYFLLPDAGIVVRGSFGDTTGGWSFERRIVAGDASRLDSAADADRPAPYLGYEVMYTGGIYNPCGYDDGTDTPSRAPGVVGLNIWLSTPAGDNYAPGGTSYDRGTRMAPHVAVGWPYDRVDIDSFLALDAGPLAGAEAELWLGGPEPESVEDIMRRLYGPYGVTVVITPAGVVRAVYVRDVYVDDDTPDLRDYLELSAATGGEWRQGVQERPLSSVRIVPEVAPGIAGDPVDATEEGGDDFYPDGPVGVGGSLTVERAAIRGDLARLRGGPVSRGLARMFRRGALRVVTASVVCTRQAGEDFAPGDEIQLSGPLPKAIRNPRTGARIGAGEGIVGLVLSVDPQATRTPMSLLITGMATDRRSRYSATATVVSYDAGTYTLTVEADEHSGTGDDSALFRDGFVVALVSPTGRLRSTVARATLDGDGGSDTIVLDDHFGDELGDMDGTDGRRAPRAGDLVVYGDYDETIATQQDDEAYLASITSSTVPYLDGDAAYVYGG